MWKNYLTVGLRALAKNKTYAFINIFGLALGLAACLLIILYVRHETRYDAWIPNSENIYQLQTDFVPQESGEDLNTQMASYAAGQALKNSFPQVEGVAYVFANTPTVIHRGQAFNIENGVMVAPGFLDVIPLPLVRGDRENTLTGPGTVILSETEASRFFGKEDPIGRTLTIMTNGVPVDHRVTAVIRNLPADSHLDISMAIGFDPATYFAEMPEFLTNFGVMAGWVYVRLNPEADPDAIRAQMPAWEERTLPGEGPDDMAAQQDYRLVNLSDIHLGPAQQNSMKPGNDPTTIITFALVAALILWMAVINFTNLATARASRRAREVALRKVLGASRKQLIAQFLGESLLLTSLAMLIALALSELFVGAFSLFLGIDLEIAYWGADGLLLPILLLLIAGGAGGIYPALFLSRYQPGQILKANKSSPETPGTGRLRSGLVVTQFAVSIGLIICTMVVYSQTAHVREINPGYNRHGLIQIADTDADVIGGGESLRAEIKRIPGVTTVAGTNQGIATQHTITTEAEVPGGGDPVDLGSYSVGFDFFETMGIELLAGRLLEESRPADDATLGPDKAAERALQQRGVNVVVNELAAVRMGFASPAAAVGKQVRASIPGSDVGDVPHTIIGVVENSRFQSAREPVQPIMFRASRGSLPWMLVRYENADPAAVRAALEGTWREVAPEVPFSARFSEDIILDLYQAEERRSRAFAVFALIAILVACLGLFGLATFTAERRTKEIGVRKVFGATVRDIVKLLAWQFSKPVILANLVAWPVAWWVMRDWLNTFDARIALTPGPFLLAGLLALGIALGTIAGHAIRVARANPIHALRYE